MSHSPALFVRSLLFNLLFYVNIIVRMIVALPTIVLPRSFMLGVLRRYARSSLWLLRVVCGVTVEWRGREKIPEGACIVACKHQSFWETFALFEVLRDPTYVLKRELMWLPLFGWLAQISKHLHNFVGPVFVVSLLMFIVMFVKDKLPRLYDIKWFANLGGMVSGGHVPSGRFNAGEKVWFWI